MGPVRTRRDRLRGHLVAVAEVGGPVGRHRRHRSGGVGRVPSVSGLQRRASDATRTGLGAHRRRVLRPGGDGGQRRGAGFEVPPANCAASGGTSNVGSPPATLKSQFPAMVPEVPRVFARSVQGLLPLIRVGWAVLRAPVP